MNNLFNNKLFRTVTKVMVTLIVITWIVGRLTKSDLGDIPFVAAIWGTASDYYVIIVTAISLVYIHETLISQKQSIEQQNEIIKLQTEELRLSRLDRRKEFVPKIEITIEKPAQGRGEKILFTNKGDVITSAKLTLHRNVFVYDELQRKFVKYSDMLDCKYHLLTNSSISVILRDSIKDRIIFILEFQDFYGFRYKQTIMIDEGHRKTVLALRNID